MTKPMKLPNKLPRYVFKTAHGVLRFKRNIPQEHQEFLQQKTFYKVLGKTYSEAMANYSGALKEFEELVAAARAEGSVRAQVLTLVKHHYGDQAAERLARGDIDDNLDYALMDLGDKLEGEVPDVVARQIYSGRVPKEVVSLKQALDTYWKHAVSGNEAKDRSAKNKVQLAEKALVGALGASKVYETDVRDIMRKDANTVRDYLLQDKAPRTVERLVGTVRTALNFLIKEEDLNIRNPFNSVIIKGAAASKDDRKPLSQDDLLALDGVYDEKLDMDVLWATLRDTGARLSEVVYLTVKDINLQDRSVFFGENALRTDLKTSSSVRTVPLSDAALEGLQRLRRGKEENDPLFPRYANSRGPDRVSKSMMVRLRKHIQDPKKTIHSLRHTMKDALRNAGVEEGLQKEILGHADSSVASRYGAGYSLEAKRDALKNVW